MSATIEYRTNDGDVATGVVWSPGPLPGSLWMLPRSGASSAEAFVVKVPRKDGEEYAVVAYDFESYREQRHGRVTYGTTLWLRQCQATQIAMSCAPRLNVKAWRAATSGAYQPVAVDASQLALVA